MPVRIMGEDLTIYRGEDGVAYAVASRCAHRGTQLSVGFVEGNRIRCLYHGWQYDGSGQCVERPAERDPHACGNIRIRSYPVVEYLGLVLVYLGEGNAPAPLSFPEFAAEGVREASFYERGCNYFQNVENGVDEVHIAFTHRQSLFQVLNYSVPEMGAQETKYGLVQLAKRSDGKVNQAHFMMPNMLTFTYPASNDPAPATQGKDGCPAQRQCLCGRIIRTIAVAVARTSPVWSRSSPARNAMDPPRWTTLPS